MFFLVLLNDANITNPGVTTKRNAGLFAWDSKNLTFPICFSRTYYIYLPTESPESVFNERLVGTGQPTTMEDTGMKRKPKMHREAEFDVDNIYQEDDRQVDLEDEES